MKFGIYSLEENLLNDILGAFAEMRKATLVFVMSFRPSASPHGTPQLPLDGFS
jgi:hypothetical protein